MKEILKNADKELYVRARNGQLTINQFKARVIEKINGKRFNFVILDDIRDKVLPEYLNLDHKEVDEYMQAAYGVRLEDAKPDGPNGLLNELEDWQVDKHCLRSIKNYGVKSRAQTARMTKSGGWAASMKKTVSRNARLNDNMTDLKKEAPPKEPLIQV